MNWPWGTVKSHYQMLPGPVGLDRPVLLRPGLGTMGLRRRVTLGRWKTRPQACLGSLLS